MTATEPETCVFPARSVLLTSLSPEHLAGGALGAAEMWVPIPASSLVGLGSFPSSHLQQEANLAFWDSLFFLLTMELSHTSSSGLCIFQNYHVSWKFLFQVYPCFFTTLDAVICISFIWINMVCLCLKCSLSPCKLSWFMCIYFKVSNFFNLKI